MTSIEISKVSPEEIEKRIAEKKDDIAFMERKLLEERALLAYWEEEKRKL